MPSLTKKRPSRKQSKRQDRFKGYQIVVRWSEEDESYLAYAPALSGCITHGSTPEKAIANCQEAVELWLADARAHGDFIPKPTRISSGKMTLCIPTSLHHRIAEEAEREGISINQWIMYKLAS